jgi:hypothetical protein
MVLLQSHYLIIRPFLMYAMVMQQEKYLYYQTLKYSYDVTLLSYRSIIFQEWSACTPWKVTTESNVNFTSQIKVDLQFAAKCHKLDYSKW